MKRKACDWRRMGRERIQALSASATGERKRRQKDNDRVPALNEWQRILRFYKPLTNRKTKRNGKKSSVVPLYL
jgi:hypothetical protein